MSGFLEQPEDLRDYKAEPLLGGTFDWNKGFSVETEISRKLPHFNQSSTQSCVACASSAYQNVLQGMEWSVRDLYSNIYQPNGGAYIRDALDRLCKIGQAYEKDVVTAPWTETHLREKAVNQPLILDAEYRFLDGTSIDNFALAIQQWMGVIAGIRSWGHCMFAKAAHLHDGKKCIVFHNSYGETAGGFSHNDANGDCHIDESFFLASDVINPGSLTPKQINMTINASELKLIYNAVFGRDPDGGASGYVGQDLSFVLGELMKSKEYLADAAALQAIHSKFSVIV